MTFILVPKPRCAGIPRLVHVRQFRSYHDGRSRLSEFWIPTGGVAKKAGPETSNDLLIRGGFHRQAYSGVFHMLPLGLRVQEKLERLIEKHMQSLGASKLSLSSISSQALWEKSGRLKKDSELFTFRDRRDAGFLLAPTHEEEITTLVGGLIKSYKDLPLRVYQISRKYRDEPRPRQGLLRGREFIMKDLYTFDYNIPNALKTYDSVKQAYVHLFDELKLPYTVAAADSGNMGGSLSHEFHIPSPNGEDSVINCTNCGHTYNVEVSDGKGHEESFTQVSEQGSEQIPTGLGSQQTSAISTDVWETVSKDGLTLVRVFYPKYLMRNDSNEPVEREVNSHAVKSVALAAGIDLDLGVKSPRRLWQAKSIQSNENGTNDDSRVVDMYDNRVRVRKHPPLAHVGDGETDSHVSALYTKVDRFPGMDAPLDLIKVMSGDRCPKCREPSVKVQNAIELAHTFHLGTRYSKVLQASVALNPAMIGDAGTSNEMTSNAGTATIPLEMGCHGIGVSRMISAAADVLADSKGLNWPRVIAPFEVVVLPGNELDKDAEQVYDAIKQQCTTIDATLDDREKPLSWKLGDADLIGYPVIVVVGKTWTSGRKLEVQCRRLNNLREYVSLEDLPTYVKSLLDKL